MQVRRPGGLGSRIVTPVQYVVRFERLVEVLRVAVQPASSSCPSLHFLLCLVVEGYKGSRKFKEDQLVTPQFSR